VPLLPESLRGRAESIDADPFRYLRGVVAFVVGGGALVALLLALTGVEPRALILAGVLWTLFGVLSGLVDTVLEPLIDLANRMLSSAGLCEPAPASPPKRPWRRRACTRPRRPPISSAPGLRTPE